MILRRSSVASLATRLAAEIIFAAVLLREFTVTCEGGEREREHGQMDE